MKVEDDVVGMTAEVADPGEDFAEVEGGAPAAAGEGDGVVDGGAGLEEGEVILIHDPIEAGGEAGVFEGGEGEEGLGDIAEGGGFDDEDAHP